MLDFFLAPDFHPIPHPNLSGSYYSGSNRKCAQLPRLPALRLSEERLIEPPSFRRTTTQAGARIGRIFDCFQSSMNQIKLRVGDWVEVRSKEEIQHSLDRSGQLEGLPFMPEMFQDRGKRFRVFKRAHKTCDTVFPVRGRRMANAVHLEVRCNGEAFGGCQAGCLIFWKTAWLKHVDGEGGRQEASGPRGAVQTAGSKEGGGRRSP